MSFGALRYNQSWTYLLLCAYLILKLPKHGVGLSLLILLIWIPCCRSVSPVKVIGWLCMTQVAGSPPLSYRAASSWVFKWAVDIQVDSLNMKVKHNFLMRTFYDFFYIRIYYIPLWNTEIFIGNVDPHFFLSEVN